MTRAEAAPLPGLLERENELATLAALVEDAGRGRGGVALVTGEAGVGKTALVRHFVRAGCGSARVRTGVAEDLVAPRTLGPFREMFADGPELLDPGAAIAAVRAEVTAAGGPLVLVVDDAHVADGATLEALASLGRRAAGLPLAIVLAFRPGELSAEHPMHRTLGALVGPEVRRVELRGLSDDAVAALARDAGVDPARLSGLDGNPFYVTEVLAAAGPGVPAAVQAAIVGRVHALPPATREILDLLAVVPRDAELALLEAVAVDVVGRLEAPERAGLVRVRDGRVAFRHEIARRALEAALPASRRVALHRRLLRALAEHGADPAVLLHHAVGSADAVAVARCAPPAARAAARADAHREAVTAAGLALRHRDLLAHSVEAELRGILARARYALNHLPEAAAEAGRAVELWERHDVTAPDYGAALLLSARMRTMVGDAAGSMALARRAEDVLEPHGSAAAAAHEMLANLHSIAGDHPAAVASSRRAIELAAPGDPVTGRSLVHLGLALAGLGEEETALEVLRNAVAELAARDAPDAYARATSAIAVVLIWWGRPREAVEWLDETERVASARHIDLLRFHGAAMRAHVDTVAGSWDRAESTLRSLLDLELGAALRPLPMAFLARLLARRGDPGAAALLDQAYADAVATGQVRRIGPVAAVRVEEAWLAGDASAVRVRAREALVPAIGGHLRYLGAEVLRYVARVGDDVDAFPGAPAGFAAGIRGDHAAAAAAWERDGNPYERALELTECPDGAAAVEGVQLLDGMGATAAADVARDRLRSRGVDVPRRARPTRPPAPLGLTSRQHEILALVADGLTSPEIARSLYLSRRTVDHHVADAMAALGVSSRRDAASRLRAAQRGRDPLER